MDSNHDKVIQSFLSLAGVASQEFRGGKPIKQKFSRGELIGARRGERVLSRSVCGPHQSWITEREEASVSTQAEFGCSLLGGFVTCFVCEFDIRAKLPSPKPESPIYA
jgi:hypothetical protein